MNVRTAKFPTTSPGQQRGIATILVVVLVGLALTATSLGIMHSVRSTQEKHVAVHAATHAQLGVWTGVEAFRRYIGSISAADLQALHGKAELGITINDNDTSYGSLTARNIKVEPAGQGAFTVEAQIVNIHSAARSSAAVGAVYRVGADSPGHVTLSAALNFMDDLISEGQITFKTPPGSSPNISVDGNMTARNVSSTKLGNVAVTGNVTYGSGLEVQRLHADGNVALEGSAWVDEVLAGGRVTAADGSGAGSIIANGLVNVSAYPNKPFSSIASRSSVSVSGGTHGSLRAGGPVSVNGVSTGAIHAKGNISISGWPGQVGAIIGEGNLTCPNSWSNYASAKVRGTVSQCGSKAIAKSPQTVTLLDPVDKVAIPDLIVNVWALKSHANYVVEYDVFKSRTKVTVFNINGVPNGSVFWVGNYKFQGKDYYSYLCTSFSPNGNCSSPATPGMALCLGNSDQCMSYNIAAETWTFSGSNLAPGILWFNGNVMLNNNYNYATFLATGTVTTGGEFRGVSANYGGYDEMCLMKGANVKNGSAGYNTVFKRYWPTNLCDTAKKDYLPIPTGNIGIAAGGYDPDIVPRTYTGGNIKLAQNTVIFGTILAGNLLTTTGQIVVHGYVSAAAKKQKGVSDNILGGNTTIDLSALTKHYDPTKIPDMDVPACATGCSPPAEGSTERSQLVWSKYL